MTVDEAIAIAETVLDGEGLNDVQELIFRQCWEGRCSYEEISQLSQYNDEYIKALALNSGNNSQRLLMKK
jgi:hypothetical protein